MIFPSRNVGPGARASAQARRSLERAKPRVTLPRMCGQRRWLFRGCTHPRFECLRTRLFFGLDKHKGRVILSLPAPERKLKAEWNGSLIILRRGDYSARWRPDRGSRNVPEISSHAMIAIFSTRLSSLAYAGPTEDASAVIDSGSQHSILVMRRRWLRPMLQTRPSMER